MPTRKVCIASDIGAIIYQGLAKEGSAVQTGLHILAGSLWYEGIPLGDYQDEWLTRGGEVHSVGGN